MSWVRHLRAILRAAALIAWTLAIYAGLVLGLLFLFAFGITAQRWRGFIFHLWAKASGRIPGVKVAVRGAPPAPPFLLVSNHLSYVDVLVLASQLKCVFVARGDVVRWPVVGSLRRGANTIFIDRENRKDVARVNRLIDRALGDGRGVVLFAEGTSTRGSTVLPFKLSLLEQAARARLGVSYASLSYETPESEPPGHLSVCWWREMTFMKHVLELLHLREVRAAVLFGPELIQEDNRKALAIKLWGAVRQQFVPVVRVKENVALGIDNSW